MPSPTRVKKLPAVENVQASGTATLRLPLGQTYHSIQVGSGNPIGSITGVRVLVNGGTIQEFSGAQAAALNQFFNAGQASTAFMLPIWFDAPWLRTRNARELGALGAGPQSDQNPRPVQTASIEFDLDATADPKLEAWAKVSPPTPSGLVRKLKRFTVTVAAAGEVEITDIPSADLLAGIHLTKATDDISRVRIVQDSFDLFDRTKAINNAYLADLGTVPRIPQTGWFHVDPREDGDGGEVYSPASAQDFRIVATVGSAETMTFMAEQLGAVPV